MGYKTKNSKYEQCETRGGGRGGPILKWEGLGSRASLAQPCGTWRGFESRFLVQWEDTSAIQSRGLTGSRRVLERTFWLFHKEWKRKSGSKKGVKEPGEATQVSFEGGPSWKIVGSKQKGQIPESRQHMGCGEISEGGRGSRDHCGISRKCPQWWNLLRQGKSLHLTSN